MAIKTYKVNDFWLDIEKKNHVDIESTDGVITSVKNNGEDIGGGGESDFSTAEVTTINNTVNFYPTSLSEVLEDDEFQEGFPSSLYPVNANVGTETHNCVLYKGHAVAMLVLDLGNNISVSGNIEKISDNDEVYLITGDCTITIS